MNKLYLVLIVLLITGCSTNQTNSYFSTDFSKIKSEFKEDMLNHFPNQVKSKYHFNTVFPAGTRYTKRCGVLLVVANVEKEEVENLKIKLDTVTVVKTVPSDKCLIIINQFEDEVTGNVYLEYFSKYCELPNYPVPNFSRLLRDDKDLVFTSEDRLSDDFTFYLIQAEKGKFLKEENLTLGFGLPKEWRNGYSKGIAINEKENIILYWLEIW